MQRTKIHISELPEWISDKLWAECSGVIFFTPDGIPPKNCVVQLTGCIFADASGWPEIELYSTTGHEITLAHLT